ncbi:MAG: class IV adenylate cyclase [Phycisphaerae bacterium]
MHLNVEIKARCDDRDRVRDVLENAGADFHGHDHQIDTYFCVSAGRLKLRQGTIETALIHYERPDQPGPKASAVRLYQPVGPDQATRLREVLAAALETRVVVDKRREIYFLENVKFHIDDVTALGEFVEIEAIDRDGRIGRDALQRQCEQWMRRLGIDPGDLVEQSYSDMLASQG